MATILELIENKYLLSDSEREGIINKLEDLNLFSNDDFFGLDGARELIIDFLKDDGKAEYDQHCDLADDWWDEYSEENNLESSDDIVDEEEAGFSLESYIQKNFDTNFQSIDFYAYKKLAKHLGFPDVAIFSLDNIPPYGEKIGTYEYQPFFPDTLYYESVLKNYFYPDYTKKCQNAREWGYDATYTIDDYLTDIFPGYDFK